MRRFSSMCHKKFGLGGGGEFIFFTFIGCFMQFYKQWIKSYEVEVEKRKHLNILIKKKRSGLRVKVGMGSDLESTNLLDVALHL